MRLTSDHIAIKPLRKVERAVGSIILPAGAQAPFMMWGEVLAVGPGHRGQKSKNLWPVFVKPGDKILYPNGAAHKGYENLRIDDVRYDEIVFINERDAGLVLRDGVAYPLYRRVVGHIVHESVFDETSSGIILLSEDKRKKENSTSYVHVRIDHVGFGQRADDGHSVPNDIQVGDIIIADKFDAWEYELLDGDALSGHVILDEDQVLAIDDDFVEVSEDEKFDDKVYSDIRRLTSSFMGERYKA